MELTFDPYLQRKSLSSWNTGNLITFLSKAGQSSDHFHHGYEIVLSLGGCPRFTVGGQQLDGLRGIVFQPSLVRSWSSQDIVLVIIVEPYTSHALKMQTLLNGKPWTDLEPPLGSAFFESTIQGFCNHATGAEFYFAVNSLLNSICVGHIQPRYLQFSERIQLALHFIQQNLSRSIRLQDIASLMQLSVERTRHFFIEQMHVTFSQYLLWKRLSETMSVIVSQGLNMKTASRQFGFTDQSHFTRMFKRFFGINPSQIVRDCAISQ